MSRTAVRKHRTKSSVDPQPNPATARTENNTPHAPNNGSDVETQGKAPPARTTMKPATKASRVAGDSPVSISEHIEPFLKQGSSQSTQEEEDLWADSSTSRPRPFHPGICQHYLTGNCQRLKCQKRHPPREQLKPCRNFQEGRCFNVACPRPHIKLEELVPAEDILEPPASANPGPPPQPRSGFASTQKPGESPKALSKPVEASKVSPSTNRVTDAKPKPEVCRDFSKGKCKKGNKCPRIHTLEPTQADTPTLSVTVPDLTLTAGKVQLNPAGGTSKSTNAPMGGKQARHATASGKGTSVLSGLSVTPQETDVPVETTHPPSESASSRAPRKSKGKETARVDEVSPLSTKQPSTSVSRQQGDSSGPPFGSSSRTQPAEDLRPASLLKQACFDFSRGRCRVTNCPRLHPPRYEWYKYYRKSDDPCMLYEANMCSAGDRCIFTHYNYSDVENVPSNRSTSSTIIPRHSKHSPNQHTRPLGNSNGYRNENSGPTTRRPLEQRNVSSSSTSILASTDMSGATPRKYAGRRLQQPKTTVPEYEPTEYAASSADSMSPQHSPSTSPITLYDDRRRVVGEPEKQICWEFLQGRCRWRNCRYKHVRDNDVPTRTPVLSADSSFSSIASTSTDTRFCQTPPSAVIPPRFAKSVPLLPPGLGLEAKQGLRQISRPPYEPPKSVNINVLDSVQVTFGPGLEVQGLQTGFESRVLFLKGVPVQTSADELRALLATFGEVVAVRIPDPLPKSSTMTVRVTMSSHEQATAAVSGFDNTFLAKSRVHASLASHKSTSLGKGNVQDTEVYLEFPAPFRHGYVGYATREDAERAIAQATGEELEECCITAELFEGLPRISAWTVKFAGLPPNAKADILQKYGPNIGVMLGPANYEQLLPSLRRLIRWLESFGELLELAVASPPYPRQLVHAYAHFVSPKVAENAGRELNGRTFRTFGDTPLIARHVRSVTYTLPAKVFDAIKSDLVKLRSELYGPDDDCKIDWFDKRKRIHDYRIVHVKVEAKQQTMLTKLKTAFEKLLRGDVIQEDGRPVWDSFFDRLVGAQYIEELQAQYPYVLIDRDIRKRRLALFGSSRGRDILRYILLGKVRELRKQTFHVFPLEGSLIPLYLSTDLRKLQQDLGAENVRLDFETRTLRVRGNEDTMQVVRLLLRNSRNRNSLTRRRRGNDCPVCFSEVTLPVTLPCGHSWCKSCLVDYLLASVDTKVFPLLCLGDEARCKQPLPITVVREILSPDKFSQVTHAAFLGHIHSRPNEFYYCPTPDCPQVYRSAPPDTVLQCPSCLTRICGNCHVEEHVGKTCSQRDDDERRLFEQWSKFRDVKDCPSCKTHIERVAGCNHVTCAHCKTHICWVCLSTFSRSEAVYNHMNLVHGGIGL